MDGTTTTIIWECKLCNLQSAGGRKRSEQFQASRFVKHIVENCTATGPTADAARAACAASYGALFPSTENSCSISRSRSTGVVNEEDEAEVPGRKRLKTSKLDTMTDFCDQSRAENIIRCITQLILWLCAVTKCRGNTVLRRHDTISQFCICSVASKN